MWPVQIGYIERKFLYPGFSSYTLRLFELFMSISFVANLIGVFPQCDTFFLLIFIYCLFFFVRYVCLFYLTGKFFCFVGKTQGNERQIFDFLSSKINRFFIFLHPYAPHHWWRGKKIMFFVKQIYIKDEFFDFKERQQTSNHN